MEKYTGLQAKKSPGGELKLKAPFPTLDCEPEVPSITFRLHLPQAAPANLHLGKGQRGAEHAAPGGPMPAGCHGGGTMTAWRMPVSAGDTSAGPCPEPELE